MKRVRDPQELHQLCLTNATEGMGIGPLERVAEWLSDDRNIALRIGNDVGLYEYFSPGVYEGHCVCESRGKTALDRSRRVLETMRRDHGARTIFGHVLKSRVGARWFYRQLGFRSVREVERKCGTCLFIILQFTGTPQRIR